MDELLICRPLLAPPPSSKNLPHEKQCGLPMHLGLHLPNQESLINEGVDFRTFHQVERNHLICPTSLI